MQTWHWLVFVNLPCLVLNLTGMWFAVRIPKPRTANLCYWINAGAMMLTIGNILSNSFSELATYGHGE